MSTPQNDDLPDTMRLYVWLSRDCDGVEGTITVPTASGLLPLIVTDERTARKYRDVAFQAAMARRSTAVLAMFERKGENLDEITPIGVH